MISRETAAVLRKAREAISDQAKWCRGALARDAFGRIVKPVDGAACQWCALGALHVASPEDNVMRMHAFAALRDALSIGIRIDAFNDKATHSQVIDLYDRAICMLEEQLCLELAR